MKTTTDTFESLNELLVRTTNERNLIVENINQKNSQNIVDNIIQYYLKEAKNTDSMTNLLQNVRIIGDNLTDDNFIYFLDVLIDSEIIQLHHALYVSIVCFKDKAIEKIWDKNCYIHEENNFDLCFDILKTSYSTSKIAEKKPLFFDSQKKHQILKKYEDLQDKLSSVKNNDKVSKIKL